MSSSKPSEPANNSAVGSTTLSPTPHRRLTELVSSLSWQRSLRPPPASPGDRACRREPRSASAIGSVSCQGRRSGVPSGRCCRLLRDRGDEQGRHPVLDRRCLGFRHSVVGVAVGRRFGPRVGLASSRASSSRGRGRPVLPGPTRRLVAVVKEAGAISRRPDEAAQVQEGRTGGFLSRLLAALGLRRRRRTEGHAGEGVGEQGTSVRSASPPAGTAGRAGIAEASPTGERSARDAALGPAQDGETSTVDQSREWPFRDTAPGDPAESRLDPIWGADPPDAVRWQMGMTPDQEPPPPGHQPARRRHLTTEPPPGRARPRLRRVPPPHRHRATLVPPRARPPLRPASQRPPPN